MNRLDALGRDVVAYGSGKLLAGLGAFLFIPLLTRSLGLEGYGRYALLLTAAVFLFQLLTGWLQQAILRFHSQFPTGPDRQGYATTVTRLMVGVALLVLAATFGTVLFLDSSPMVALAVGLFALSRAVYTIFTALNQSELKPARVIAADLMRTVVPLLLVLGVLVAGRDLSVEWAFGALVAGLFAGILWHYRTPGFPVPSAGSLDPLLARRFIGFGAPVGVWMALSTLQLFLGRTALDLMGMHTELGIYSAFQDVALKSGMLVFIPVIHAVHPRLMSAWNTGETEQMRRLLRSGTTWLCLLAVVFLAAAWLLYPILMKLLFSAPDQLLAAEVPLRMLFLLFVLAEAMGHFALLAHKGFEFTKRTGSMALIMLACTALNAVLLVFLAAPWGLYGVLASLMVSRALYLVLAIAGTFHFIRRSS